jgi:ABC-type nitrate/sulfonate/bicarbonate transport system permease component
MVQEVAKKLEDPALILTEKEREKDQLPLWQRLLHPRVTAIVSVFLLWQIASWVTFLLTETYTLPTPYVVFREMIVETILGDVSQFLLNLGSSLLRIVIGFGISLLIGVPMGIVMGIRKYWEAFFGDYVVIGLTIPSLAWAIIGVLWFGIQPLTPIFATFMITFPYITINIWEGMKDVDKELVDMARAFGVSRGKIIRRIYIPSLMPFFFASIRFGFAVAWKIVILAEVFGAESGIGYMISYWYHMFNMRQVLAWVVVFTILMFALEYGVIRPIERKVLSWRPEAKV